MSLKFIVCNEWKLCCLIDLTCEKKVEFWGKRFAFNIFRMKAYWEEGY